MCWCNPRIQTPYCGALHCTPEEAQELATERAVEEVVVIDNMEKLAPTADDVPLEEQVKSLRAAYHERGLVMVKMSEALGEKDQEIRQLKDKLIMFLGADAQTTVKKITFNRGKARQLAKMVGRFQEKLRDIARELEQ